MIFYHTNKLGGFSVADDESGYSSFAHPCSRLAKEARENPHVAAVLMLAQEARERPVEYYDEAMLRALRAKHDGEF